jgi:hypothetical protein
VGGENGSGGTNENQPLQVEVDPKYKGLPEAEAIARTIQSRYDKLNVDFIQAQKDLQAASVYKGLLSDLYQNEDALYAFLAERKPDLIGNRDIKSEMTKKLAAKFGEGFKPTLSREDAEKDDVGGKDWLYYQEVDNLKTELLKGNGQYAKYKNLQEFKATLEAEAKAEDERIEQEISQVKTELKMSDAEVEWTRDWAGKLSFKNLTEIARFLRRFKNTPSMGSIPGSANVGPAVSKTRQEFVNSLK